MSYWWCWERHLTKSIPLLQKKPHPSDGQVSLEWARVHCVDGIFVNCTLMIGCIWCLCFMLCRENELLKHQLKKYVSAVQMLRRQGARDEG